MTTTPPEPSDAAADGAPLARWEAWRRPRAEALAAAMWPLLQRLGEANKAGLLVEVGALGGELAVALSKRSAWRDLLAVEERGEWLRRGALAASSDPALHRLDFCRALVWSETPRLPVWSGEASGAFALGALGVAPAPGALLAEIVRVLRPGGTLLLGEPASGWLGGWLGGAAGRSIPADLRRPSSLLPEALAEFADEIEPLHFTARAGLRFALARKRGE